MKNGSILANGDFLCPYCGHQEAPDDGVSHACGKCSYSSWITGRQGTMTDLHEAFLSCQTPPRATSYCVSGTGDPRVIAQAAAAFFQEMERSEP